MLWGGSATALSFLLLHLLVESAQSKTQNGKNRLFHMLLLELQHHWLIAASHVTRASRLFLLTVSLHPAAQHESSPFLGEFRWNKAAK